MKTFNSAQSLYDEISRAAFSDQKVVIRRDGMSLQYHLTHSADDPVAATGPELTEVLGWFAEDRLIPISVLANALILKVNGEA